MASFSLCITMSLSAELPSRLPILPSKNKVLLPGAVIKLRCTSPSSMTLVKQLWQKEGKGVIGVLPVWDSPKADLSSPVLSPGVETELGNRSSESHLGLFHDKVDGENEQEVTHWHTRGVAARALRLSREVQKPSGKVIYVVHLEGLCRFSVQELSAEGKYYTARISSLDMMKAEMEQLAQDPDFIALSCQFKTTATELTLHQLKQKTGGLTKALLETVPVHKLADIFVASCEIGFEEQLSMLDAVDVKVRLLKANKLVGRYLQSTREAEKIAKEVEGHLSKAQEFFLRHQTVAKKKELHDNNDDEDDMAALERRMQSGGMPSDTWKYAQEELRRLKKMQPRQPEYSKLRSYLEFLAELPWKKASEEHELDIKAVKQRLDSDHYGFVKVKQRIIEYLAVCKLKPDARGPVLCFVGPPGIGKTSLASSIAAALGRKFVRISLGGVADEADIRGRRREYTGSMPGHLIDGIKRVGVCNPVVLLDEIDRYNVKGNTASPLLEVFDPEKNKTFHDRYLNVPFDLSKVIFVATANKVDRIPQGLLDRMEIIKLTGYAPEEKLRIAIQHLIPKVLDQHGLSSDFLQIPEAMLQLIIQNYTREAGVRYLERNLAALARAAAVRVAEHNVPLRKDMERIAPQTLECIIAHGAEVDADIIPVDVNNQEMPHPFSTNSPLIVDEAMLEEVLGPWYDKSETAEQVLIPGVSLGLRISSIGGKVSFNEASMMVGSGKLRLTGLLTRVSKESAEIALTWVRAHAPEFNLVVAKGTDLLEGRDIHIHRPEGAVPKNGPSAGVALVTSLVSMFSQRRARADTAMTGEMTLRGAVLSVGGIKDKVLGAHRYGIKRIILPKSNLRDLADIPEDLLSSLEIIPVMRIEEVLEQALEGGCPWREHSTDH